MKRILAISLSLILVVSTIVCVPLQSAALTGADIAGGAWYCCNVDFNNPSGPYWTGSGYDCYPQGANSIGINNAYGLAPYGIYTKLDGLKPNTAYTISFNYDVAGAIDASNTGVILNKDNTHASIKWVDNRIDKVNNTVYGLATDDTSTKTASITFTTDDNTDYILSIKAGINASVNFSNFTLIENALTGAGVAGGNWYINFVDFNNTAGSPYWSGSGYSFYPQGDRSLGISAQDGVVYYGCYTKLDNLNPFTTYHIRFNYDVSGAIDASNSGVILNKDNNHASIKWVDNRIDKVNNTVFGLFKDDAGTKTASVTFTTDANTNYYLSIKAGVGSAVNFTNFTVETYPLSEEAKQPAADGAALANSTWWCSTQDFNHPTDPWWTGSGYNVYPQGPNSIGIDNSYGLAPYAIYTKLSGLTPNTHYTITFECDKEGGVDTSNTGVILNKDNTFASIKWQDNRIDKFRNDLYGIGTVDPETGAIVVPFTTDEHTEYFFSIKAGLNENVTYKNFKITKEKFTENLFENGNFAQSYNNVPTGWTVYDEQKAGSLAVSTTAKDTPTGDNAITFTSIKGNIGAGTWWNGLADCENPPATGCWTGSNNASDYFVMDSGSIGLVNDYYLNWPLYTKLNGLEPNTKYTVSFQYNPGYVDASSTCVVASKDGAMPAWLHRSPGPDPYAIDPDNNDVFGYAALDDTNGVATIQFETDDRTDYFLVIKGHYKTDDGAGGADRATVVSFSNFKVEAEGSEGGSLSGGSDANAGRYFMWNNRYIHIKRNTKYTFSFYANADINGLRFYLYEPSHLNKNGGAYRDDPLEGYNIYTYDSDVGGVTRVSRTDIQHTKALSNGTMLSGINSMAMMQTTNGEWTKVTHTFTTGDLPEHEAKVRYGFLIPCGAVGDSISMGSFTATAEPIDVEEIYTPLVNDPTLGTVSSIAVETGKTVTVTATPADGRVFDGWYQGNTLVSEDFSLIFEWDGNDPQYEARFSAGNNANLISSENFESNKDGEILVGKGVVENGAWSQASVSGLSFEQVTTSTTRGHGSSVSAKVNAGGSYVGYTIEGLEPNTKYAFSAYAWLPTTTLYSFNLQDVWVLPKGQALFDNGEFAVDEANALARMQNVLVGNDKWQRFAIPFTTDATGAVTVWMKHSPYCNMYLDDLAVFKPVTVSAEVEWGGTASVAPNGVIVKGSKVSFAATPYVGNYFVAWETNGNQASTELAYHTVANTDLALTAVFDGANKATDDIFAARGWDGTFENGTIPGWYGTHKNAADAAASGHCTYTVSNRQSYEGKNSLRVSAYHRSSILPITGLKENTDYRLSFYYMYEDNGALNPGSAGFSQNAVIGKDDVDTSTANIIYDEIKPGVLFDANTGWYKADFYFNTGNATAVNYLMYYGTSDFATGCVFFDNMTLTEYFPNEKIVNADFSQTVQVGNKSIVKDWITEGTPEDGALAMEQGQIAYQTLKTEVDGTYTISFRAKGELRAAAVDLIGTSTAMTELLSSVSYVDCDSNGWKNHSFTFYSGAHKAVKLMFEALSADVMLDDITLSKAELSDGGIVEKIDFESDRFAFAANTDNNFSISDEEAHSGDKALKLTVGSNAVKNQFLEPYIGFRTVTGVTYTVQVSYKGEKDGGEIYISPDIKESYCVEQGFTYQLENGWKTTEFHFVALDVYNLKVMLKAITDSTKGTVYFDDIIIKTRLPLIDEYNLEKTYCEDLYNVIEHQSFEKFSESSNWGKLPSGFSTVKDDNAAASTHVLTVKAGSKHVFAFKANPATVYELGVSLRGNAKTKGSVSVVLDKNASYYYTDVEGNARSIITAPTDGKWKREAFSFSTSASGIVYVAIECTAGEMVVDNLMLFEKKFATLADNNDYIGRRNYDYSNPNYVNLSKDDTVAGDSEGQTGNQGSNGTNASLGDFVNLKVVLGILLAAVLVVVSTLLVKKRKEEYHAK